jgi:hypothetical protein
VIGTMLNVMSFLKFKLYLKTKYQDQPKNEMIQMLPLSAPATTSTKTITNEFAITNVKRKAITVKKNKKTIKNDTNERQAEKTMFYMALTLCSISILTRLCIIFNFLTVLNFSSFSNRLTLMLCTLFIFSVLATFSLFVFYAFDRKFRYILHSIFSVDD